MTTSTVGAPRRTRQMLNKVPEVTIWFWIIKILCTTVGESFADWINMKLGVGLDATAVIFTVVFAVVLVAQLRLDRYVPFAYWLTVVVVSVTGTLYTDILTDDRGVPLKVSSAVFTAILIVVFGVWYARERTLSIHSIVTLPRELFYWLAVLVTFALGTATGDWTLELTGWSPGRSVLLPATLIAVVTVGWKAGANPVLAFWLAYILTRPLGANLGDWFASPRADQGLGLGTAGTSVIFLAAIGATVAYLSISKADVTPNDRSVDSHAAPAVGARQNPVFAAFALVAVGTGLLLNHASHQPHTSALAEEEGKSPVSTVQLPPGQAVAHFPAPDVANFRTITQDTLDLLSAGKQSEATARIKDLETAWDDDQSKLQAADSTGWDYVDGKNDVALSALRAKNPDVTAEKAALNDLLTTLSPASPAQATAATTPKPDTAVTTGQEASKFPAAEVATFKKITQDTLDLLTGDKQAEATKRIKDLETAWDDAEPRIKPQDSKGWTAIDHKIDKALTALRAKSPKTADEKAALTELLKALG